MESDLVIEINRTEKMSDIKVDRESSKLNMEKCKFCHQSSYSKLECKIKKEIAIVEIKSEGSIGEKQKGTCAKENQ